MSRWSKGKDDGQTDNDDDVSGDADDGGDYE